MISQLTPISFPNYIQVSLSLSPSFSSFPGEDVRSVVVIISDVYLSTTTFSLTHLLLQPCIIIHLHLPHSRLLPSPCPFSFSLRNRITEGKIINHPRHLAIFSFRSFLPPSPSPFARLVLFPRGGISVKQTCF